MPVEALRIDGDDLSELMGELETSFDIHLPRDLMHVVTVGDLHREIVERIDYDGADRCPTSMVFYALRRVLAEDGLPPDARPSFRLRSLHGTSPAALRRKLVARTEWNITKPALGWIGCGLLMTGAALAFASWWWSGWLVIPILGAATFAALRLDQGSWHSSSSTLGSLARSVAARNHAKLAKSGAQQTPATVWQALVSWLGEYGIDRDRIGPNTRLSV